MKKLVCLLFVLQIFFSSAQNKTSYYRKINSNFGSSAISNASLTVKTFSFNYPVYKVLKDTLTNHLIVGVRQKDPSGKLYTSKGYHLTVNENDSVSGIIEDNKFDLVLVSDFLLLSNNQKSSRFNLEFGYEQFEYASKILYPIRSKNTGLTYNPAFRINNETGLSCLSLKDGSILWTAPVPDKYNWNSLTALNDSMLIIAAGGLHGININSGLVWSYPLTTAQKINKPLTFSSFNRSTFAGFYNPFNTSHEEAQITQISSNILLTANAVYFASKQKLIAIAKDGKLKWEVDLSAMPVSNCILFENKENVVLVNLGIAQYNENTVLYGKPFISAYNKESGTMTLEKNEESFSNIVDMETLKDAKILANKNEIIQIGEDLKVQTIIALGEARFGHFLEFINGDEYFVEKEGFYVPLNFINDKIIYFKTDHGKVFGLNNNEIEYEYHYTELYKFNKNAGRKKLISQKNKTYLISENYELLYTFNSGEQAIYLNNKIYFAEGRLLHIINVNDLK